MVVGVQSQVTMAPKLVGHLLGDCSLSNMVCSAFFTFFAPAHPFLMPRSYLLDFLCNGGNKRQPHLEMAIQFIGSCYVPQASPQLIEEALRHTLFQQGLPRDSFMVQALLLYAIGLKANDRSIMADEMLSKAIEIALTIGMNDRDFAIRNGCGNRVLEESWRRTWWELYIADGFFAGVSQRTNFRLKDVQTDVPLPCEEDEYGSGVSFRSCSTFNFCSQALPSTSLCQRRSRSTMTRLLRKTTSSTRHLPTGLTLFEI